MSLKQLRITILKENSSWLPLILLEQAVNLSSKSIENHNHNGLCLKIYNINNANVIW